MFIYLKVKLFFWIYLSYIMISYSSIHYRGQSNLFFFKKILGDAWRKLSDVKPVEFDLYRSFPKYTSVSALNSWSKMSVSPSPPARGAGKYCHDELFLLLLIGTAELCQDEKDFLGSLIVISCKSSIYSWHQLYFGGSK